MARQKMSEEERKRKNREKQARWRAANPEKAKHNTMMYYYRRALREMQKRIAKK